MSRGIESYQLDILDELRTANDPWLSIAELAAAIGRSRQQIRRDVSWMAERGLIQVRRGCVVGWRGEGECGRWQVVGRVLGTNDELRPTDSHGVRWFHSWVVRDAFIADPSSLVFVPAGEPSPDRGPADHSGDTLWFQRGVPVYGLLVMLPGAATDTDD